MEISNNSIIKKNVNVIERNGEDALLLFDSSLGRLFEVNETGRIIWKLLDGEHTVEEIKYQLKEEYESAERIEKDTRDFLNKLIELNLIEKRK